MVVDPVARVSGRAARRVGAPFGSQPIAERIFIAHSFAHFPPTAHPAAVAPAATSSLALNVQTHVRTFVPSLAAAAAATAAVRRVFRPS